MLRLGHLNHAIPVLLTSSLSRSASLVFGTIRGGALAFLGLLSVSSPVAAQCSLDFPTEVSLKTARMALDSGATDVALSPGGCLRYRRSLSQLLLGNWVVMREETSFDGKPMVVWDHAYPPSFPLGALQLTSFGTRDTDLDGFNEWRATVTRDIPPPTIPPPPILTPLTPAPNLPTHVEVTEFDPNSQMLVRRTTSRYPGDGTVHVSVEEGVGTLQIVSKYEGRAIVEQLVGPSADVPNPIACPTGLVDEVMTTVAQAAAKRGQCLRGLGMFAEAAVIAQVAAARRFMVVCDSHPVRAAGIDLGTASDPIRAITLIIDVADWAKYTGDRESFMFHELLHIALGGHDTAHNALLVTDRARWQEMDRVGACTRLCMDQPNATKCECARCLGKKNCDGPCPGFKACHSTQVGGTCYCPQRTAFYDSLSQCNQRCSSGLACFGYSCTPEVNACKP